MNPVFRDRLGMRRIVDDGGLDVVHLVNVPIGKGRLWPSNALPPNRRPNPSGL